MPSAEMHEHKLFDYIFKKRNKFHCANSLDFMCRKKSGYTVLKHKREAFQYSQNRSKASLFRLTCTLPIILILKRDFSSAFLLLKKLKNFGVLACYSTRCKLKG